MSFAKITEVRTVKKIVAYILLAANERYPHGEYDVEKEAKRSALEAIAANIEYGRWKDVKLPKAAKPTKKAKKR